MPTMHTLDDYSDLIKNYIDIKKLGDFVSATDVTVSSVTYHTYWKVAPTSSNQVYGVAVHPTNGRLYRIYNNKGAYSVTAYDADNNTTTGDGITTKVAKTGTNQSSVSATIAASTTMDNAIGALLNNDVTVNTTVQNLSTVISKNGAKNLLPFDLATIKAINTVGTWSGNVYSNKGIEYTVYEDGSVKVNGTAGNDAATLYFARADAGPQRYLEDKDYILTGCPSDGTYNNLNCYIVMNGNYYTDVGKGIVVHGDSASSFSFNIFVKNTTVSNKMFYPMIRLASDTDPTYQPWAKTNQQLTQETTGLLDNVNKYGCKNILDAPDSITLVTSSNTAVTVGNCYLEAGQSIVFVGTQNSAMASNTRNTLRIENADHSSNWNESGAVSNYHLAAGLHEMEFTAPSAGTYIFMVWGHTVSADTTYSKFMVCDADIYAADKTYVPYAKSNKELTEDVTDIPYVALTDNASSQYTLIDGKIWQTKGVTFLYVVVQCNTVSSIAGGNHIKVAQIPDNFKKPQFIMYPAIVNVKDGSTHIGAQFQINTNGQLAVRGGETGGIYSGLFSY